MRIIGRKNREWYPGAIYHLMERVIRRQEIFKEENDYSIFLAGWRGDSSNTITDGVA